MENKLKIMMEYKHPSVMDRPTENVFVWNERLEGNQYPKTVYSATVGIQHIVNNRGGVQYMVFREEAHDNTDVSREKVLDALYEQFVKWIPTVPK